ncbi:MAG TPA: hypothetical protein DCG14_04410 [Phycisphaerales bacterium]|nr:hypothetical protein [Phycisphaerales bacterium]
MRRESERLNVFTRYIGEISMACERITGSDAVEVRDALESIAARKTAEADQQLDDEGRIVDDGGRLASDDSVIILEQPGAAGDADAGETAEGGESLFAELSPPKKSRGKIVKKSTRKTTKKKRSGTASTGRRKSGG